MIFEIINYFQGKLILAAIIYLVFCCFDCKEANKAIDRYNEQHSDDYHIPRLHRAPFAGCIIIIIILLIALISPLSITEAAE